jgi:hypothetical protein
VTALWLSRAQLAGLPTLGQGIKAQKLDPLWAPAIASVKTENDLHGCPLNRYTSGGVDGNVLLSLVQAILASSFTCFFTS